MGYSTGRATRNSSELIYLYMVDFQMYAYLYALKAKLPAQLCQYHLDLSSQIQPDSTRCASHDAGYDIR
jgi:hypothetical protein